MERIKQIAKHLKLDKGNAFLVSELVNIRYLTGFSGSSALLLVLEEGSAYFFTDFRYKEQSEYEVKDAQVIITKGKGLDFLKFFLKRKGINHLFVEDTMAIREYRSLAFSFNVRVIKAIVESFRRFKNEVELANIRKAVTCAEEALISIKGYIKKGVSERSIALRLEEAVKAQGASKLPFDFIVAAGANSSLPHARASDKKIAAGELLIIDWGAEANGYFSDMTRTFIFDGSDIGKKVQIYGIVLDANKKAISAAKCGLTGAQIDFAARKTIEDAGYGQYFGHGTGHGVGLNVHEEPTISRYGGRGTISATMVFTIEPGIYIPGLGGVRIEDMVVVDDTSTQLLTSLSKEIEIIRD
ncbi:MAG: Xaa-Pro peptidase family protein [Candidatus Magnetoovum sp. WYHC-5]|nr:Xaa-Pro peptidase family protein [Candidatus Magnetoovum sp. WYHC-5]